MHNRLIGWINGRARKVIGGYWGSQGICLAHRVPGKKPTIVYVPASKDVGVAPWDEAVIKLEALNGITRAHMALAIAISTDDVFVRSISVPEGLNDQQLEQVAIIEAVANLPVPPEEICLDFVRGIGDGRDEGVDIAFCRRDRIDAILAEAEEIGIPVHVVDRDIQAIHDAISESAAEDRLKIEYPMGIVLTEVSPRIAIFLGPTDFEQYPIRLQLTEPEALQTSLVAQLASCWTRCRMGRESVAEVLEQVFVLGNMSPPTHYPQDNVGKRINSFSIKQRVEIVAANGYVPEEVLLIALGMSGRCLA
jgi:hypothetical protein